MKRIVKRVALLIGGLALVSGAVWFIGFRWGFTPLPKPPHGVRIKPLLPPLARKDIKPDNAAFHYLKATDLLESHTQSKESTNQLEALLAGETSGNTKDIEQTLIDCREALNLGRDASDMSFCQMPLLAADSTFLNRLRQLAKLLTADGKLAQRNGDSNRAIANYLAVVKIGTDCAKGGALLQSLVGKSITEMGTRAIRDWILRATNMQETRERIVESLRRDDNERTPYAETLRYELQYTKEEIEQLTHTQEGLWGRTLYSKRVTNRYLEAGFGELIQASEKPYWQSDAKNVAEKWTNDRPSQLDTPNRPLQRNLMASVVPIMAETRRSVIRAELDLAASEIVYALKAYELTRATPPDRLSNLVPKFLPSVPIDPFDGKQLRYRREGKEWVIWSVGSDLKDDNAAWHEFKYRDNEERKGGDIFYRSTEPQDDLAYYLAHKDFKEERERMRLGSASVGPS